MDINDLFRGFFGFHRFPPTRSPHDFHRDDEDGTRDQDNVQDDFFEGGFPSMFQQMENMFNNMFSINSGFLDFPNLEMIPEEVNPRDVMLKGSSASDSEKVKCLGPSCSNEDKIPVFTSTNFRIGFPKTIEEQYGVLPEQYGVLSEQNPKTFNTFHKSVSTKYVHSPDGVIEEHKSVTDHDGKTVTTVRKTIGDKTYQVTTERDKSGIIEKKEDFINIDENDVAGFQQDWDRARKPPIPRSLLDKEPVTVPPGDTKYASIFKKFFG